MGCSLSRDFIKFTFHNSPKKHHNPESRETYLSAARIASFLTKAQTLDDCGVSKPSNEVGGPTISSSAYYNTFAYPLTADSSKKIQQVKGNLINLQRTSFSANSTSLTSSSCPFILRT
jgi:hypothetical protein